MKKIIALLLMPIVYFSPIYSQPSVYQFKTLPALNVTSTSAQLQGVLEKLPLPANMFFQYGTSPAMSNQIAATPSNINDTLQHDIAANVGSLQANSVYYFSMKGVSGGVTYYADTLTFYTGNPIPNWDFEIWDTSYMERPTEWITGGNVRKVSSFDAGNAIEIKTDNTGLFPHLSAVMQGVVGDEFVGGAPFTARPDSVRGYFKYDLASGDTAFVVVIMKKAGVIMSMNVFNIMGNSGGAFANLSFPISYETTDIPDSIIMAFTSSQISNHIADTSDKITVDKISFSGTTQNVPDPDFENWTLYTKESARNWTASDYPALILYGQGSKKIYSKTDDSYSGSYAASLEAQGEYSSSSVLLISESNDTLPAFPIQFRPSNLHGYYKYYSTPPINDQFRAEIRIYYHGEVIGQGSFDSNGFPSQYTSFNAPITYYPNYSGDPDSASIVINASINPYTYYSRLIIDALSFNDVATSNENILFLNNVEIGLKIYPVPSKNIVMIEIENNVVAGDYIEIFSLNGQLLNKVYLSQAQHKVQLDVADLSAGFYLLNVNTGNNIHKGKIIVAK